MTSITKELREYTETFSDMGQEDYEKVLAIADHIDAELAEQYIALPLDAAGVPIHIGDVMQMIGDSRLREVEGFYGGGFLTWLNGKFVPCAASFYRHAKPDTWECIIYDAMQAGRTEETVDVTPIIERCKALAEKEMN